MFYSRLFIFLEQKCQSYYFVKSADYFSINSKYFKDFFQISYLRKILSLSLWQLVTQLVHSSFGDNHLVFLLVVNQYCDKMGKCLQTLFSRLSKIFGFRFNFFENLRKFQK